MGLQLLLGGSGFGKSYMMYDQVVQKSIAHPEKNYFIVVPEQYTMQVQKTIVRMHPDHITMNIDVVSFGRLAYRFFDELGLDVLTVLDDIGKSMVVRRVVNRELSKLKMFQGNAGKAGFISEMKSTISELLQYHISPEDLQTVLEQLADRPALKGKITDIEKIYGSFMSYISEKYITTEEILDRLVHVIDQSKLARRSEFYFDEFTGFTPSQYDLLGELMLLSSVIQISLTVDAREDVYQPAKPYELFHLTRETIYKLNKLCLKLGIERDEDIVLPNVRRFASYSALAILEKNIFRNYAYIEKCASAETFSGHQILNADGEVEIYVMQSPSAEMAFVTQEILKLCREGLKYRDIAIVTGDLSSYGHIVESAMKQANIPFFIDQKKDVLANGFIEFLRALIDVIVEDFSYNAVFRYLKTGWTNILMTDIDRLDNYVLAAGVRGYSMWSKPFERHYRGITENELTYVNQIREEVMTWLVPVKEAFREQTKTAGHFSETLLDFLVQHDMEVRVQKKSEWFEAQGELSLAKEYQQIYQVAADIFARIKEIIDDDVISVRNYRDILDAGFNEAKVGIIPPAVDQVMVGDITRTRLDSVSVLFFIGVNDGVVPGAVKDGGLINDRDKEALKDCQFELSPTGKQDLYTQHFYIYSMLTKPSRRLVISYTKADSSSKMMRPSPLIARILKILPDVYVKDVADIGANTQLYSLGAIRKYLAKGLRESREIELPKLWFDLYLWMTEHTNAAFSAKKLMDMAFAVHEDTPLSKAAVKALYGNVLEGSVTMLEKYAACAYSHFLSYGLGLNERQEYHLSAPDLGILFHSALELFSKQLADSEYSWHSMPENIRCHIVDQCVETVAADDRNLILTDNFRNRFILGRLKRMVQRTVWALQMQMRRGSFEPADYELRFDSSRAQGTLNLALSEQEVLKLVGVIDRLDMYETDDEIYVRIIDYKSGTKKFDMAALFYGLQLQLVVYMEAAMDLKSRQTGGKKVIPAGILYYNINDPVVQIDSASLYENDEESEQDVMIKAQIDNAILKALMMNGLVNSGDDIIRYMDAHIDGASDIIPVTVNKDGSLSKSSSAASTEDFEHLFAYTADKVKNLGRDIMNGSIGVHPYDRGARGHGCNYCPYKAVCGFDEDMEGYTANHIREMSKDEVWQRMNKEETKHGLD